MIINTMIHIAGQPSLKLTGEGGDGALDVVGVVPLNAWGALPKEEGRPGDEDDPRQGEDGEEAVPQGALLLQEDPRQQGGEHWATEDG